MASPAALARPGGGLHLPQRVPSRASETSGWEGRPLGASDGRGRVRPAPAVGLAPGPGARCRPRRGAFLRPGPRGRRAGPGREWSVAWCGSAARTGGPGRRDAADVGARARPSTGASPPRLSDRRGPLRLAAAGGAVRVRVAGSAPGVGDACRLPHAASRARGGGGGGGAEGGRRGSGWGASGAGWRGGACRLPHSGTVSGRGRFACRLPHTARKARGGGLGVDRRGVAGVDREPTAPSRRTPGRVAAVEALGGAPRQGWSPQKKE